MQMDPDLALRPSGVLQGGDAALWFVGSSRHGGASPGRNEKSWRPPERHHVRILQQGRMSPCRSIKA